MVIHKFLKADLYLNHLTKSFNWYPHHSQFIMQYFDHFHCSTQPNKPGHQWWWFHYILCPQVPSYRCSIHRGNHTWLQLSWHLAPSLLCFHSTLGSQYFTHHFGTTLGWTLHCIWHMLRLIPSQKLFSHQTQVLYPCIP